MKKLLRNLIVAVLSLTFVFSTVGCGEMTEEEKQKTLFVMAINKGYGVQWLEESLKAYCAKNGLNYLLDPVTDDSIIKSTIEAGAGYSDYDLIFYSSYNAVDSAYLEDLTSFVKNEKIVSTKRNDKTIKDVLSEQLLSVLDKNYLYVGEDEYYDALPWTQGVGSILVNVSVVKGALGDDWEEKYSFNTTEEFIKFCDALKAKNVIPLSACGDSNQYYRLAEAWWAQYEGIDVVENFFNGKYYDEDEGKYVEGANVMKEQGLLEGLKVLEQLFVGKKYNLLSPDAFGLSWDVADSYFMMGDQMHIAMKSAGDWTEIENSKNFSNVELQFIKLPIVSSLGTKFGISDEELSAVISYVDGKSTVKPTFVATSGKTVDEIIDYVREARKIHGSYVEQHLMSVVNYNKVDMAKDFIKFMISDEGQSICFKYMSGLTMPYGYDYASDSYYSSLNTFGKSRMELVEDMVYLTSYPNRKFAGTNLRPYPYLLEEPLEAALGKGTKTAQQIFDYDFNAMNNAWSAMKIIANQKYAGRN